MYPRAQKGRGASETDPAIKALSEQIQSYGFVKFNPKISVYRYELLHKVGEKQVCLQSNCAQRVTFHKKREYFFTSIVWQLRPLKKYLYYNGTLL